MTLANTVQAWALAVLACEVAAAPLAFALWWWMSGKRKPVEIVE